MKRFFAIFLVASLTSVGACRKGPPDEIVFTGRKREPPPIPDAAVIGIDATIPPDSGEPPEPFTKHALLEAIADCTIERLEDFEAKASALDQAATLHLTENSTTSLQAVRDAWRTAFLSWQESEVFQIGPAAHVGPGARGMRDQIYSWPLVSRCRIEEQIVSGVYQTPGFPNTLINARGLGAIEYLLFYTGADNACSQFSTINANGTWAALGAEGLRAKKMEYAKAAAADVLARARQLLAEWSETGANFRQKFIEAGASSSLYPSDQAALNAASDALFYVEKDVKDIKLGRPLGLSECPNEICPNLLESLYARVSTEAIRANLSGFRRLFQGCHDGAGLGFDDWLKEIGSTELADRMSGALAGAIAFSDAFSPPLEQALLVDQDRVWQLYGAIKAITDPLKTEMTSVLDLELPMTVEGDND